MFHLKDTKWFFLFMTIHLILTYYFFGQIGDDAFVFFRYAENFAKGHGLLWNVGEQPVEGYSSPLWVLILGFFSFFSNVVYPAQLFGSACMFLAVCRVWQLSKLLAGKPLLATIGISLSINIHYWASAGLETGLHALVVVSALLAVQNRASFVWLSLLGISRPEGPFLVFVLLAIYAIKEERWKNKLWVLIPTVLWLIFRIGYYNEILPNTYYAKVSGDRLERWFSGFAYAKWVIPTVIGGLIFDSKNRILWCFPCGLLFVVVYGGGDWMWYGRLLIPVTIVLWGLATSLPGFVMLLCCFPLSIHWIGLPIVSHLINGERLLEQSYQEGSLVSVSHQVAEEISQNVPSGSLIAVNHAGALPYFLPQYSFVDMSGLNDHYIARINADMHGKYDPDYVLNREPDLVVMNSFSSPQQGFRPNYWEGETALYQHPAFQINYVPIAQAWERSRANDGFAYIFLFKRKRKLR